MRTMVLIAVMMCTACVAGGDETTVQAVGPGGVTVTATPVAGELAVSWSPDPAGPFKYYVFQSSTGPGGPFSFVTSVLDPSAQPPAPTSYLASGLAAGQHCYAIESAYTDGSMSELGPAGCGTATDATGGAAMRSRRFYPTIVANDGTWTRTDNHGVPCLLASGTSTTGLYLALPYDEGDRITGLSLDVKGGGDTQVVSFSVTSELYNVPLTGASVLSLVDDRDRSGAAWSVLAMPSFTPKVLTGERFLYLAATHTGGGYCIGAVRMFYDRPGGP